MMHQLSRPGLSSITYYRWLALGAALLAAVIAFSGQISRGDENEGSGIGGTGRTVVPGGESGLGGTGFRPYLGSNTDRGKGSAQPELVLREDNNLPPVAVLVEQNTTASIPAPEMPVPRVAELITPSEITSSSSPISIVEQIQHDLDRDVFLLQQAAEYRAEELEGYVNSPFLPVTGRESASTVQSGTNTESGEGRTDTASPNTASTVATSELNWSNLAAMLGKANSDSQASAGGNTSLERSAIESEMESDRIHRPERIARPSLPPVQRVRPLQRPGLLPPRIRPLPF